MISYEEVDFDTQIACFHPKQRECIAVLDKVTGKYVLYGGAMGGGKSRLLRWYCVRYLIWAYTIKHLHWTQVMLACEDYPSLKDRQIVKIEREFPAWLGKSYTDHKVYGRCFILNPNFGHGVICLRNLDDASKYASSEFALICVDELTKNLLPVFNDLRTRIRWPGLEDTECKFLAGSNPGCFPGDVDVLTSKGWRNIKDITTRDRVASLTESRHLVFKSVQKTHKYAYKGKMLRLNQKNGICFLITPNHKVVRRFETKYRDIPFDRRWRLDEVQNLPKYTHIVRTVDEWVGKVFTVDAPKINRNVRSNNTKEIKSKDYCALLGWFLSEGSLQRDDAVCFAQTKVEGRKKLSKVLDRIGIRYTLTEHGFSVYSKQLVNLFSDFGNCREKYIPRFVLDADRVHLDILLQALMSGDGHWRDEGVSGQYYTLSKQLADDVAEVCVKLGYAVRVGSRDRSNREYTSYEVLFHKGDDCEVIRDTLTEETFVGDVYCLTVPPYHNFLVRSEGSIWWSGNSVGHGWVKNLWITRSFPEEFYPPLAPVDYRPYFQFIKSKAEDNPSLDASYWSMLSTLPKALRAAFRDGDWNTFIGQAFQEWDPTLHVCKPMPVPEDAPIYVTHDWGFGAPFSFGWWWVDHDGRIYRFHEKYGWTGESNVGLRLSDDELCGVMLQEEARHHINSAQVVRRLAGRDCFAKRPNPFGGGQGPATATVFAKYKDASGMPVRIYPGDPNRILKIRQFHNRLALQPHNARPMMQIYSTCEQFIRTIPDLVVDPNNIEDIDTKGEDHIYDEACHICMARPISVVGKRVILDISDALPPPETVSDMAWQERDNIIKALEEQNRQEAESFAAEMGW